MYDENDYCYSNCKAVEYQDTKPLLNDRNIAVSPHRPTTSLAASPTHSAPSPQKAASHIHKAEPAKQRTTPAAVCPSWTRYAHRSVGGACGEGSGSENNQNLYPGMDTKEVKKIISIIIIISIILILSSSFSYKGKVIFQTICSISSGHNQNLDTGMDTKQKQILSRIITIMTITITASSFHTKVRLLNLH